MVCASATAQSIDIDEALQLARRNNGTIKAALLNYEASKANSLASKAQYYPSVTPTYSYDTSRSQNHTGFPKGVFNSSGDTSSITASWMLLDNGVRNAIFKQSLLQRDSSEQNALWTVRQILFGVHQSFYDALRADELLLVNEAQLLRAQEIEKQTQAFIDEGAIAPKDILQARADALNAKASHLTAANQVTTARASLRAILGLDKEAGLPELVKPNLGSVAKPAASLDEEIAAGLEFRPRSHR